MLFGSVDYDVSVDLWAVVCTFAELLSWEGQTPFPGGADLEQLCLIFQALGTPCEVEWPEVINLPDYRKVEFKERKPVRFQWEGKRSLEAINLLYCFLRLTPGKRISASAASSHECFLSEPLPVSCERIVQGLP